MASYTVPLGPRKNSKWRVLYQYKMAFKHKFIKIAPCHKKSKNPLKNSLKGIGHNKYGLWIYIYTVLIMSYKQNHAYGINWLSWPMEINAQIHWGVSDHHKSSPDPIIFWKHRCSLMYHNIFMKGIGSIIFILNH